jgi:microsomal dipeptidase-like Zn-dependent dipeptidase
MPDYELDKTDRTPIIDLHAHPALDLSLPQRPCDNGDDTKRNQLLMDAANHFANFKDPFNLGKTSRYVLKDAKRAGINLGSVLYNPADEMFGPCEPFANLTRQRNDIELALGDAQYRLATTPAELKDAIDKQQPAAFHCIEGGFAIGDPANPQQLVANVRQLAKDGVAYIILAHLVFREISGCVNAFPFFDDDQYERMFKNPTPDLTQAGVAICETMCDVGIIPDITHMTVEAATQVLAIAKKIKNRPVIVSHGAPQGKSGRQYKLNLNEKTILGIRDSGGVIGVIFYDHWLLPVDVLPHTKAFIRDVINAMKRIREVAGTTECIAIGSDLEGFIHPVDGLEDVTKIRDLETELRKDGSFTADEVDGILWKNALRVLSTGWGT